jgi:hypothetical protein
MPAAVAFPNGKPKAAAVLAWKSVASRKCVSLSTSLVSAGTALSLDKLSGLSYAGTMT